MPMYESLPLRVVLTVEVDGHVLTFEETGKATGARYHGADPRKSGRSGWGSLESATRETVDNRTALVAERARVYLARAYPTADDAPAPAAAQPAEPIDWGTCLACGESEANCRAMVECCGECATAGFRAMHVPAAQLLAPPAEPAPAPAPMSRMRSELHALAPLPWTADECGEVRDALSRYQFCVSGQNTNANDARLAELVVRIVNEPEPATLPASVALRALAVDEVIAAAQGWGNRAARDLSPRDDAELCRDNARLRRAVCALDALDGPGGAA